MHHPRQITHRLESLNRVGAENLPLRLYRLREQSFGTVIEPQAVVDFAHHLHHLRLCFGILGQACADIARRFVQNFSRSDGVTTRLARIRNFEHALHETGDAVGAIAFAGGTPELNTFSYGKSRQDYECSSGDCYSNSVTPCVLSETI